MLHNLMVVSEQVGVLFLLMGTGFLARKLNWIDRTACGQMSTLLLYIISPCVIVNCLQTPFTPALLSALIWGCGLLVIQYALTILVSLTTFRGEPPETRGVLRFAQVYSNNVFMGLPLVQAVLGAEASIFVVPSMVVYQLLLWTHGAGQMGGKMSLKKAFLNPGIIGVAVGFVFFLSRIALPPVLGDTVRFLSGMNTPLAMIIIGIQMADADFRATFTSPRLYGVSLLKLFLPPVVTILTMLPLRLTEPNLFCALVILSAAPCAGVTSIFAQRFRRDTSTAAQVVTLSTLLSLLTLPLFAVIAQALAGL